MLLGLGSIRELRRDGAATAAARGLPWGAAGGRRWRSAAACAAVALGAAACGAGDARSADSNALVVVDAAGQRVELAAPAARVVSLLPAATETLFALGAGDVVVGRTRYDTEPHLADIASVGGGLDPSLEAILALSPDVVLAFETAGGSRFRGRLEQLGVPVFTIQSRDTADVFANIERIGALIGREESADSLARSIRTELERIGEQAPAGRRPRALHVASIDPPIIAGPRTYVSQLIGVAGAEPIGLGAGNGTDWPQVSLEALVAAAPDVVVLPVGGDPTSSVERLESAPGWRELAAVREGRIAIVETDLVSRPGPRLPEIARALRQAMVEAGALP